MKYCVQNYRDESLVGVIEDPKKLKKWILNRAKEALAKNPEKFLVENYQFLQRFLNTPGWYYYPQSINSYMNIFKLPFEVSLYGVKDEK